MNDNNLNIFGLLMIIDLQDIKYHLIRFNANSLTIIIIFPEKRIEIECMSDNSFIISVFSKYEFSIKTIDEILEEIEIMQSHNF